MKVALFGTRHLVLVDCQRAVCASDVGVAFEFQWSTNSMVA